MTELNTQDEVLGSAIGCIPSGLYIVTSTQDGKTATMLGSWVQQAAFNPPSVTIAVAKGRYIESFLTPGSSLVINILANGQGKIIGHFSKNFEPGIDPLAELSTGDAPSGQRYLLEAIAYIDAEVISSFDAGDHSIVLAKLNAGEKLRDGEIAVHTRKSGFKY